MILQPGASAPPAEGVADFVEWDVRNWSVALRFWTRHTTLDLAGVTALEVGSRHGGLSLWLALQGARVVCSDVTDPSPLAVARHREAGVANRISYERIDARRIPYVGDFDLVLFKSVLGAVGSADRKDEQAAAVAGMHRALRPGGELFFAENLVASPLHRFLRRRFVSWGTRWRYVAVPEMLEFLAPFSRTTYRTVGFAGALGRTSLQHRLLGGLDRALLDSVVPARWRYIMIGVARKKDA